MDLPAFFFAIHFDQLLPVERGRALVISFSRVFQLSAGFDWLAGLGWSSHSYICEV